MQVEIDLSNRLEESGPTYVALANHITCTIKVPTKVKRVGLVLLKTTDLARKQIKPQLWAACLFLLLNSHLIKLAHKPDRIIIDNEYDGHQVMIKRELLHYIRGCYNKFPAHKIAIGSIGKKSPAHNRVIQAKRGKRAVDRVVTEQELVKILS